jgi:GTP-binding protein LepA
MDASRIRNFCIVAHIDHGKSTLADRFLEICGVSMGRERRDQVLDSMDLERERGITIKSHPVRLDYSPVGGGSYRLNLIDTPGHVDFSYEVSRSLAACEGAILIVDAAQGVEAQTVSNFHLALEAGLALVPAVNKIDLDRARVDRTVSQLVELTGCEPDQVLRVSARTGEGVRELLEAVVAGVPCPAGDPSAPLRALVFDSHYDRYRGAVAYVRVVDGRLQPGQDLRFLGTETTGEAMETGCFHPGMEKNRGLETGDVGYVVAGLKDVRDVRVGDTVTLEERPASGPLPGYREVKPVVFCGLYPLDPEDYEEARGALEKLRLNDSSFSFVPEGSGALGQGFRCGFLGLLHMEIIRERLEREFDLALLSTHPQVDYRVRMGDGGEIHVDNPSRMPDRSREETVLEPVVRAEILTPAAHLGAVMTLATERRGEQRRLHYLDPERVALTYDLPLAEILTDFHDRLKSVSRGHATFDYEILGYRETDAVRLDILVGGDPVDALSVVVHRSRAYRMGRELVDRLKELLPRQQFSVAIQAMIGSKVIARSDVKALRKNVTSKCYGGDITRKRKLLERQKEGKRRMKRVGNVEIPQEAFLAVMSLER